jgi:mRNA interferase RelE/StbE
MSYSVEYEPEALAGLERLPESTRERVINKITGLAANFDQITAQALTVDLSGFFKLRIEDYSVIDEFSCDDEVISIDRIGHRREVYD